ncbi:hypothetical protein PILCRDRAFT_375268 [Piloderma croceum F 1598]|uniref:Secreted protein n=1 Tax=Piloderma croceum (strain F 1598) TaxID=765440 RepID=A0A0C3FLI5_PILCF|nr:hypothetical protein PILCRDRAFT_375268 [Piloderma croceum F 1598]
MDAIRRLLKVALLCSTLTDALVSIARHCGTCLHCLQAVLRGPNKKKFATKEQSRVPMLPSGRASTRNPGNTLPLSNIMLYNINATYILEMVYNAASSPTMIQNNTV